MITSHVADRPHFRRLISKAVSEYNCKRFASPEKTKNFYDRSPHVFQSNWFTITLPTHTKARTHTSHTVIHTSLPTNHTAIRHLPGTSLRGRSPAAPASGDGGGWLTLGSPGHLSPHCIQITFKRHVMPHPMPCHATSCHNNFKRYVLIPIRMNSNSIYI